MQPKTSACSRLVVGALVLLGAACAPTTEETASWSVAPTGIEQVPELPSWSEQTAVREDWLLERHEMILPLMRNHGLDMWIVVNEEFHDDPLTQYVAPARPYAGRRDIFVFVDAGEDRALPEDLAGVPIETVQAPFGLALVLDRRDVAVQAR